jgi:hypothetical protein
LSNLPTEICTAFPTAGLCTLAAGAIGSERDDSVAQPLNSTTPAAKTAPYFREEIIESPSIYEGEDLALEMRGSYGRSFSGQWQAMRRAHPRAVLSRRNLSSVDKDFCGLQGSRSNTREDLKPLGMVNSEVVHGRPDRHDAIGKPSDRCGVWFSRTSS